MINAETPIAVSLEFGLMLPYEMINIDYGPSYTYLTLKVTTIRAQ